MIDIKNQKDKVSSEFDLTYAQHLILHNTVYSLESLGNSCSLFFHVQVSLIIRGIYVPVFWTANTEFADKKTHFD
jgi:hypothetical protein